MLLVEQAMRDGWGVNKLAKEARTSPQIAADVLAMASQKVVKGLDISLGVVGAEMRMKSHKQRSAVIERLEVAGAQCDALQRKAGELLERLGGSERQTEAQELATLAGAVERSARAALACWSAFKDASGLALAERVAEARAKAVASKQGDVDPWAVDFQVVDV